MESPSSINRQSHYGRRVEVNGSNIDIFPPGPDRESTFRGPMARDVERHQRIVSMLRFCHWDAFFCSLPTQVLLLSGYWPVMGTSAVIFTVDGAVHLLVPTDEEEIATESSLAERTLFQPARLDAITNARDAIQEPLIELFRRLKLERATVGIEVGQFLQPSSYAAMSSYRTGLHEVLGSAFPDLRLVSADCTLERLKATKTTWEVRKIKAAARIAKSAFEMGSPQIAPGVRESEIASVFQSALEKMPPTEEVQRSYGFFACMSGPNSAKAAAAYARTRQRTISKGDLVMIHCNSCGDGFWTDITRTYAATAWDTKQEDMREVIMEAREAALASIAPGVNARDVDHAARAVLERRGFGKQFKHATGHEVGFSAANHNAVPRIHPESPDVLSAGMTFNIEPAIYIEDYGGIRHCDIVRVTDVGVEVLTDF